MMLWGCDTNDNHRCPQGGISCFFQLLLRGIVRTGTGKRLTQLGEAFAGACPNNATEQELKKARNAPLRAPMIIVGIASPKHHPKVPEVEQILAAGSGMTLLSLALNDAGFGTMWRTGPVAYAQSVHSALGLEEGESIVGFLYTGSVIAEKPRVPRPENSEFVEYRQSLGR